jgi:hypothetical protein
MHRCACCTAAGCGMILILSAVAAAPVLTFRSALSTACRPSIRPAPCRAWQPSNPARARRSDRATIFHWLIRVSNKRIAQMRSHRFRLVGLIASVVSLIASLTASIAAVIRHESACENTDLRPATGACALPARDQPDSRDEGFDPARPAEITSAIALARLRPPPNNTTAQMLPVLSWWEQLYPMPQMPLRNAVLLDS